jgi:phosphopantetheinyl transferase
MIVTRHIREEWFTPGELAVAGQFKLPKRREEWLRSRTAAKELALQLGIAREPQSVQVARPRLIVDGVESEWYVSLSHSRGWAAAAIDRTSVGVDLEVVRPVDERAAHLFLRDDEAAAMLRCNIADRLLHWWAAKEAAWKQRSNEFGTLKQLPLSLVDERADGLIFDVVTTERRDDLVLAVTRVSS